MGIYFVITYQNVSFTVEIGYLWKMVRSPFKNFNQYYRVAF